MGIPTEAYRRNNQNPRRGRSGCVHETIPGAFYAQILISAFGTVNCSEKGTTIVANGATSFTLIDSTSQAP